MLIIPDPATLKIRELRLAIADTTDNVVKRFSCGVEGGDDVHILTLLIVARLFAACLMLAT
jgi:hypothetical protein